MTKTQTPNRYDSQKRVEYIASEIESWPSDLSKDEYGFRLNVLLKSALHRGEAHVVQFLESKGAKIVAEKGTRKFRINLRFMADVRNWLRFFILLLIWWIVKPTFFG